MIRRAEPADSDAIADLLKMSFLGPLADYMVYAQHGIGDYLRTRIEFPALDPQQTFLVHNDETEGLLGFAEFRSDDSKDAFLSYICVAPHARRRGVALALIRSYSVGSQAKTLHLDVFANNSAALALYKSLGFIVAGKTEWFAKALPSERPSLGLALHNRVEAVAMYSRHGFCRFECTWNEKLTAFGRIGPRTLRVFESTNFGDAVFLSAVRGLFPEMERVLIVCAPGNLERPVGTGVFQTSLRLVGSLPPKRRVVTQCPD